MLPTILVRHKKYKQRAKNNFFQNSTKDKMTHFNISLAVKLSRDNKKNVK